MPYKYETEKTKIPRKLNRNVKLLDKDREKIKGSYGLVSQRKLASMFQVSRRLIQFIGNPSSYEKNLLARKLRGGEKQYYNKEKNNEYVKEHRHYKKELYDKGLLIGGDI